MKTLGIDFEPDYRVVVNMETGELSCLTCGNVVRALDGKYKHLNVIMQSMVDHECNAE